MSYCRFSCNDYQCDLYCYQSRDGYVTHVASNKVIYKGPLPPLVSLYSVDAYIVRYRTVMKMLDDAERVPIGLPHDGKTFSDDTLEDFMQTLLMLKECGYRFPAYVIDDIAEEIAEEASAEWKP